MLPPCEASAARFAASGTVDVVDVGVDRDWDWDPAFWQSESNTSTSGIGIGDGGACWDVSRASGCHASGSPSGAVEFVKEKTKKKEKKNAEDGGGYSSDAQDSMNVDDLSELLTHIEAQEEDGGVDFSVFIEDEDALNVEEISDVFSALEEVTDLLPLGGSFSDSGLFAEPQDDEDAQNVDAVSELFGLLEQEAAEEAPRDADVCDAANVDEVSELFSSLEECSVLELEQAEADRDDAANVDAMADLFSELAEASELRDSSSDKQDEQKEQERRTSSLKTSSFLCGPVPAAKMDARIFVPQICVRIEGRESVSTVGAVVCGPRVAPSFGATAFLAGPPQLLTTSSLSREDRVERWREKRKSRSFAPREPDACVSDTRRACAAKRQRVKGRFTSEKSAFVSITALQN